MGGLRGRWGHWYYCFRLKFSTSTCVHSPCR
jgi:hypothetical protein